MLKLPIYVGDSRQPCRSLVAMTSVRQAITYFLLGAIALGCGIGLYFEDVGRQPILWWLLVWPALVLWLIAYWYLMDR